MAATAGYYLGLILAFNLLVNLLWFGFAAFFAWTRPHWVRISLVAFVGAVLAVLPVIWPQLRWLIAGWPTLLLAAALVYLAVRPESWRQFIKAMAGFMLFAGAAGGAVLVLREWRGLSAADGVSVFLISAGLAIGGIGALWVWQYGRVTLPVQSSLYQLRLCVGGEWVELTALLDSGHQLLTPITRRPVAIVSLQTIQHLLPPEVMEAAGGGWEVLAHLPQAWRDRCQLIRYQSLGQPDGMILAVAPDRIELCRKEGEWVELSGAIGLSPQPLQGEYQALIPPQMVGDAARK